MKNYCTGLRLFFLIGCLGCDLEAAFFIHFQALFWLLLNLLTFLFSISSEKIFQYMKERKYFMYRAKRQTVNMKPIVCYGNSRLLVAFSTSNNKRTEHHLCRVCDRGCPTYKGLSDHYTHPVHTSQERKEIEKIKKVYIARSMYLMFQ